MSCLGKIDERAAVPVRLPIIGETIGNMVADQFLSAPPGGSLLGAVGDGIGSLVHGVEHIGSEIIGGIEHVGSEIVGGIEHVFSSPTSVAQQSAPLSPEVNMSTITLASTGANNTQINLGAVNFAIKHVGDGAFSSYGLGGTNSEAGGWRGQNLQGWSDPKCNIFVFDAYASAGAAPELANGTMPLAANWYNTSTPISASNGGSFEVVATGDLSKIDLHQLQPGDIVSNGSHVGIYAPIVYTSGENSVPGFSNREVVNLGDNTSLAYGEEWIRPQTISAATPNPNNEFSSSRTQPWMGGVTWNGWGFRGDSHDNNVVVRRLVTH